MDELQSFGGIIVTSQVYRWLLGRRHDAREISGVWYLVEALIELVGESWDSQEAKGTSGDTNPSRKWVKHEVESSVLNGWAKRSIVGIEICIVGYKDTARKGKLPVASDDAMMSDLGGVLARSCRAEFVVPFDLWWLQLWEYLYALPGHGHIFNATTSVRFRKYRITFLQRKLWTSQALPICRKTETRRIELSLFFMDYCQYAFFWEHSVYFTSFWSGSKRNWASICKALQRDMPERPIYALDLRNHGSSPHALPMSYEAMASDVRKFIEDKKLNNVALLGHSM